MLAYEPTGAMALPSPDGIRFLGIEPTRTRRWKGLRHVFDLGEEAGLHVVIVGDSDIVAFAVGYDTFACDEKLTAL